MWKTQQQHLFQITVTDTQCNLEALGRQALLGIICPPPVTCLEWIEEKEQEIVPNKTFGAWGQSRNHTNYLDGYWTRGKWKNICFCIFCFCISVSVLYFGWTVPFKQHFSLFTAHSSKTLSDHHALLLLLNRCVCYSAPSWTAVFNAMPTICFGFQVFFFIWIHLRRWTFFKNVWLLLCCYLSLQLREMFSVCLVLS